MKSRARRALQQLGIDVRRFPDGDPGEVVVALLKHHDVDVVLDVGANDGGYARALRRFGYTGSIVSFEPLDAPFARLSAAASGDPAWSVVQCALGDVDGEVTVNIASNAEASSSVLPMLERHLDAAPTSAYRGSQVVRQRRIDDVAPEWCRGRRPFLKIDVQGYERQVLDGAADLVANDLVGLQIELAFVPLYAGGLDYWDAMGRIRAEGYGLAQLLPGFRDRSTGELLQADGVFFRGAQRSMPGAGQT